MDIQRLVKMLNEIAVFFDGAAGAEQAPQEIATHLKKYWDPRMRQQIIEHCRHGAVGLSNVARAAVQQLQA
jgi:formate dehydrogenase subunit delta